MSEFLANFHFLRPLWLILLLLPAFMYWHYFKGLKNQSSWEKVCDKNLLDFLLVKGSSQQRKSIGYLALVGMLTAIIAISGPTWKKKEVPSFTPENPVMIVLNLSTDMQEKDLSPSRLERAKYKIIDLLTLLKTPQVGLIVYAEEPFLVTPITDDVRLTENLLPEVTYDIMPANGSRLDRAIELATEKLKNAGYNHGNIVVLTSNAGTRFDLTLSAAKQAKAGNYAISLINISKESGEKLKLIAEAGGGLYEAYSAGDKDIKNLVTRINSEVSELKLSENLRSQWLDMGYYLIIIPLLSCLYFFRKGIIAAWFLLLMSGQAQAGFFLNNNQEGYRAFQHEDYAKAAEKFENPQWKASSLYKMGDYEEAYKNFATEKDTTSLYNQGNALAKGGKIEEAIKKYEEILAKDSKHEDAKFNLEYLKKQQDQNQQSQNSQSDQNKDQNQKPNQQNSDSQQQELNKQENEQQSESDQPSEQDKQQEQKDQSGNPEEQKDDQPKQAPKEQQAQSAAEQESQEKPEESQKMASQQKNEDEKKYDEEAQAKAQQYREIPENTGGLLKAFIRKEYMKKRYEK